VERPGQIVGLDCFYVGRLSGTRGVVWQYTAIDTYSSYLWAELHVTPRDPSARFTSALAHRVAGELRARGWALEAVLSDNASEFTSADFAAALAGLGARHRRIHAGRPQANGAIERVQLSVLEECWRPAFARYLIPKLTGLRRELARYVHHYNTDRAHTGRITRGRTPEEVLGKATIWTPRA
jgi:transposase InsO family protein